MELTSSKNDTWKYFAAGSFAGFFLLLLLAYQTHPYTSLLAAPNSVVDLSPLLGHIDAANASPAANPALQDRADDLGEAGGAKTSTAPKPVLQGPAADLGEAGAADSSTAAKPVLQGPADDLGETDAADTSTAAKPVVQGPDDDLGETDAANTSTVAEPVLQGTSDGSIAAKLVLQDSADSFDTDGMNLNITVEESEKKSEKKCDIFEGKWVYKPEEDPGYDSVRCPFIEEKMSCRKNGRPDFEYENWRWEARDCDIPVFNGTYMLERLRNKRVILAGDSLNRNMWESLACLLYSSIPSSTVEVQAVNPVYKVLKAKEYNCTVEFYWSPFLVEFVEKHVSGKKVLVLDKLSQNSMQWLGADVMVFNSGHWWLHGGKMKSWDVFEYEGKLVEEMPIELAYERAMTTWAKWMKKKNIDPRKTKVFFRSLSAVHQTSQDWCYNATQPITDDSYITQAHHSDTLVEVIKRVIKGIKKIPVKYLNISKLSQYRRDAHPSIYRSSQWKVLIKKFEDNLAGYADCSHWCLPGLPDTWNRLLYASLFFDANVDNFSS